MGVFLLKGGDVVQFAYTCDNKLFFFDNDKPIELTCGKTESYRAAIADIRKRTEWKETGTGANFMGTARYDGYDESSYTASITGLCFDNDDLIYSYSLDSSGGLCRKSTDASVSDEGHIYAGKDLRIKGISCKDKIIAFSLGNGITMHLATLNLDNNSLDEITDGDSAESNAVWSKSQNGTILYSATGLAVDSDGRTNGGVSPASVSKCDLNRMQLEEVVSDDDFDYICPRDDANGNIYYIKRPYKTKGNYGIGDILFDVVLFPVRLIKTVFGIFNFLAIHFAGESLKTAKNGKVKAKQKTEEERFVDGNLVNVRKNLEKSKRDGDEFLTAMPKSWVLIKRSSDGTEEILAKGVLSFDVADNGDVVYSNGNEIILLSDGTAKRLAKAGFASNICIKN